MIIALLQYMLLSEENKLPKNTKRLAQYSKNDPEGKFSISPLGLG